MNLVQFKRHDGDGDVFINPAHVAMVEPSTVGDDNVTDVVVAAQTGRRRLPGSLLADDDGEPRQPQRARFTKRPIPVR